MASELDAYYEQIANRSAAYRGQAVQGNLTNTNGVQPGSDQTVAGGQQVIITSSNIDGKSQLDNAFAVVAIPDDPNAYISDAQGLKPEPFINFSGTGNAQAILGNAGQITQAGSSFGGWDITR
jgi:hypothetical protein